MFGPRVLPKRALAQNSIVQWIFIEWLYRGRLQSFLVNYFSHKSLIMDFVIFFPYIWTGSNVSGWLYLPTACIQCNCTNFFAHKKQIRELSLHSNHHNSYHYIIIILYSLPQTLAQGANKQQIQIRLSFWRIWLCRWVVFWKSCLLEEMSFGRDVFWASCLLEEMSFGRNVFWKRWIWAKCPSADSVSKVKYISPGWRKPELNFSLRLKTSKLRLLLYPFFFLNIYQKLFWHFIKVSEGE